MFVKIFLDKNFWANKIFWQQTSREHFWIEKNLNQQIFVNRRNFAVTNILITMKVKNNSNISWINEILNRWHFLNRRIFSLTLFLNEQSAKCCCKKHFNNYPICRKITAKIHQSTKFVLGHQLFFTNRQK